MGAAEILLNLVMVMLLLIIAGVVILREYFRRKRIESDTHELMHALREKQRKEGRLFTPPPFKPSRYKTGYTKRF